MAAEFPRSTLSIGLGKTTNVLEHFPEILLTQHLRWRQYQWLKWPHCSPRTSLRLGKEALTAIPVGQSFEETQQNDPWIHQLTLYLMRKELPEKDDEARKIVLQAPTFTIVDSILYFIDNKHDHRKRAVVPKSLQQQLMRENHGGRFGGHFSGPRTYAKMALCWWWDRMYSDIMEFCKVCPECATVSGIGRRHKPPLHPIPVSRPFQILGVDLMELPITSSGNRYVVVFQICSPSGYLCSLSQTNSQSEL